MATREETYSVPEVPTREAAANRLLTRAYALNWEAIAYGAILLLALVTRFVDLGARVMSHDESLHTYYSWRLYQFGEFQHTPLMHGPLLFHMTALSYFLFGDNDFTARLYPAILGVLIVMFPVLFRRWLGRLGALAASIMLLISPQMLYYSRYIREDIPTIFYLLVMVYGIVQYVDGRPIRRPGWLLVVSAGLIGMLATKEVAFIYVAIFGSFLTLYWLLRVVQDIGIQRRPRDHAAWHPPALQLVLGHLILAALVGLGALILGAFLRLMLSPVRSLPSALPLQAMLFVAVWAPLAASGLIRRALGRQGGVASAIMQGLAHGQSALLLVVAGAIVGGLLALVVIVTIDIIKPETIWTQTTVLSEYDQTHGVNATKEYAVSTGFDTTNFVRMLTWVMAPTLLMLFAVFLSAVFTFPGTLPLPWRELLLLLLIAVLVAGVLVIFERRSFVSETTAQPFAADPTASAEHQDGAYNNLPLWVAWGAAAVLVIVVLVTRFFTGLWDFLNRQPVFDVLILIGTLILPWLTAFPLYWAGYNLENYNTQTQEGSETVRAAFMTAIPFLAAAAAVGLAWNWRRWLPAAAVFGGIFAFFFTTVFSNQNGLVTGAIGSLGYWLEQQEVRRGSQPQYYYVLTQLPVYEYLPVIGALGAGVSGIVLFWRWRRDRRLAEREAVWAAEDEASLNTPDETLAGAGVERTAITDAAQAPEHAPQPEDGPPAAYETPSVVRYSGFPGRLVRPYDAGEEARHRRDDPEWIGALPFLGMVGYWGIMNLLALSIAGEKMPWLTTHLTVPLILAAGWWFGRIASGLRPSALREGSGPALLVAIPVGLVALAHVVLGLWGKGTPFVGRRPDELAATGTWLAALLIFLGALYVIGRFGRRVGRGQLARAVGVVSFVLLVVLTARTAVMASYINYDYATEYLVYAHAGPAIKTVLHEVDRIAAITNEGHNMRIVFDDESSWPYTWYFRHYSNYGYLRGEAGSVDPATLDGARVVVVGGKKAGDVRRILGDGYYEFNYIRLWWPMQEYFNLTYDRVANVFSLSGDNVAARYYRAGLFDIWWRRDYSTYAQAMCIENRQPRCEAEADWGETPEEQARYRSSCLAAVVNECRGDQRFAVNNWPVSDRMYVFVDKQIAARVWDAGIGSSRVDIREPEYPEDRVFRAVSAQAILGQFADLMGPRDIVLDADGRMYIADTERNRVVILAPDGSVVQTIGTQPGGSSEPGTLRQPWGIALGPDGEIYVADTWNHRVQVFSPEGEFLRMWGHEGIVSQDASPDAFWGPRDVAIGPNGLVYVADTGNKRVRVYTPEGEFVRDIGGAGAGLGQLDEPVGMAFHPLTGDLYVADTWNKRVHVFDMDGLPLRVWDVNMWFANRQSYNRPYLAINPAGTLVYVTDMDDKHRIVAYTTEGVPALSFNLPKDLEAGVLEVRSPAGLAFDAAGNLYVVDAEQGQPRVVVFPAREVGSGPAEAREAPPVESDASEQGEPIVIPQGESADDDALGAMPEFDAIRNEDWLPIRLTVNGVPAVYVPEGCFPMGEADAATEICLSAFWIGQTEVTNAQYAACVEAEACPAPSNRLYFDDPQYADAPVVYVSWSGAQAYAEWVGGALPTEAQWEYAARGPSGLLYPWGDEEPGCGLANLIDCGRLQPAGDVSRRAGASWVGALDMAGNVWEWTADWADDTYYSALEEGAQDPPGPPSGTLRVVRGGSWNDPPALMRTTARASRSPREGYATVGFRVVLPVEPAPGSSSPGATEEAAG